MVSVPVTRRRLGSRVAVTTDYAAGGRSVPLPGGFTVSAGAVATGIGLGRVVIGMSFLAAPVLSVRVLGLDSATAKRVTFLARMAAARDIGLGAGTLSAGASPTAVPWLAAGALADLVDAAAIAAAMRSGTTRGVPAVAIVAGAAATAATAGWAALGLRRRPT